MPIALYVDKLEPDGTIRVRHVFFGDTLSQCEKLRDQHAGGCKAFGPAIEQNAII